MTNLVALSGEDGVYAALPDVVRVYEPAAALASLGVATAHRGHGVAAGAARPFVGDAAEVVMRRVMGLLPSILAILGSGPLVAIVGRDAGRDVGFGVLSTRRWLEGLPFAVRPLPGLRARYVPMNDLVEIDPSWACLATDAELRDVLLEECLHRVLYRSGLHAEGRHHVAMRAGLSYASRMAEPRSASRVPVTLLVLGAVGVAVWLASRR